MVFTPATTTDESACVRRRLKSASLKHLEYQRLPRQSSVSDRHNAVAWVWKCCGVTQCSEMPLLSWEKSLKRFAFHPELLSAPQPRCFVWNIHDWVRWHSFCNKQKKKEYRFRCEHLNCPFYSPSPNPTATSNIRHDRICAEVVLMKHRHL